MYYSLAHARAHLLTVDDGGVIPKIVIQFVPVLFETSAYVLNRQDRVFCTPYRVLRVARVVHFRPEVVRVLERVLHVRVEGGRERGNKGHRSFDPAWLAVRAGGGTK